MNAPFRRRRHQDDPVAGRKVERRWEEGGRKLEAKWKEDGRKVGGWKECSWKGGSVLLRPWKEKPSHNTIMINDDSVPTFFPKVLPSEQRG